LLRRHGFYTSHISKWRQQPNSTIGLLAPTMVLGGQAVKQVAARAKEVGKGTGLGLATCYGIVKQPGGHSGVYSEAGHRTTFKIYLPSVADVEASSDAVLPQDEVKTVSQGSARLLLVEDEPLVHQMFTPFRAAESAGPF
jgi:hypothetical protein